MATWLSIQQPLFPPTPLIRAPVIAASPRGVLQYTTSNMVSCVNKNSAAPHRTATQRNANMNGPYVIKLYRILLKVEERESVDIKN